MGLSMFGKKPVAVLDATELGPCQKKLLACIKALPFGVYAVFRAKVGDPEKVIRTISENDAVGHVANLKEMLDKVQAVLDG